VYIIGTVGNLFFFGHDSWTAESQRESDPHDSVSF
jgi:hypothetical protein